MMVGKHVGLMILGIIFVAAVALPKILLAQDHGPAQQQQQEQPRVEQTLGLQGGLTVSPETQRRPTVYCGPGTGF